MFWSLCSKGYVLRFECTRGKKKHGPSSLHVESHCEHVVFNQHLTIMSSSWTGGALEESRLWRQRYLNGDPRHCPCIECMGWESRQELGELLKRHDKAQSTTFPASDIRKRFVCVQQSLFDSWKVPEPVWEKKSIFSTWRIEAKGVFGQILCQPEHLINQNTLMSKHSSGDFIEQIKQKRHSKLKQPVLFSLFFSRYYKYDFLN